jgi:iron complex outermembrane receptor protein
VTDVPIIGVSIYVPELHKGTTDLEDAIPWQIFLCLKLLFEYVGYSNQVKTIKISQKNDLNVTLEPTVFEMDAVIVSTFQ